MLSTSTAFGGGAISTTMTIPNETLLATKTTNSNSDHQLLRYCKTNGTLEFTTQYFPTERLFQVHILQLRDFEVKGDTKFGLNAWVSVYLDPGKQQKTETNSQIGDVPFFNEKLQFKEMDEFHIQQCRLCLLYTSPSPRDKRQSRMPSSA